MYSYGSPHMAAQKQDDQLERTFSSYVRIQAVVLKTYLGRWTIGRSGERGSGISVLPARYDDDVWLYYNIIFSFTLLVGEGICKTPLHKRSVLGMTLNFIWWWGSNFQTPGNIKYPLIAITLRSTLTRSGCTHKGSIYGSNRSV